MDPGHVDFFLHVSENLEQAGSSTSNAMPVPKLLSFVLAILGLVLVVVGVDFFSLNPEQTIGAISVADKAIGSALIASGTVLVATAFRSCWLFIREVLELLH